MESMRVRRLHTAAAVLRSKTTPANPVASRPRWARISSSGHHIKHSQHTCAATGQQQQCLALPEAVLQRVGEVNQEWLTQSLQTPLQLPEHQAVVYVLGVCFWAPLQHQLVQQAVQQLQPLGDILIEQPESSSDLLLPHPDYMQTLMEHQQLIHLVSQQQPGGLQQQLQQQLQALAAELSSLESSSAAAAAKVGKDIIDPYETFGYYAGADFVRQPDSSVQVLQSLLFLPGEELLVAAQSALEQGAQLRCIDAPLRLQETWVKNLLANFSSQLDEQAINSYTPLKDLKANQQVAAAALPPAAAAWDKQLADAAAQLQQQAADASASAAQQQQQQAAAERQALLLFKVSKATAAALLAPEPAQQQAQVLTRLSRLQPLKFRHFALRQQYMAQQIKEAAVQAAKQAAASSNSSSSRPARLLVVVGRQHCAGLRALWNDPTSSLWRTQVARGFAPSVVEPEGDETGPTRAAGARAGAAAEGGSVKADPAAAAAPVRCTR